MNYVVMVFIITGRTTWIQYHLKGPLEIWREMKKRRLKKTLYSSNQKRMITMTWFWRKVKQFISRSLNNRILNSYPMDALYAHGKY